MSRLVARAEVIVSARPDRAAVVLAWLREAARSARASASNIDPEAGAGWRRDRERLFAESDRLYARAAKVQRSGRYASRDLDHVPHTILAAWFGEHDPDD